MTAKCKEFLAKLQGIPLSEGLCFMDLVGQYVSQIQVDRHIRRFSICGLPQPEKKFGKIKEMNSS